MHTVVIADDVTGANDIGIMYAKAGHKTLVYSYGTGEKKEYADCDVLVIDTDSRFDTRKKAYEKVQHALKNTPKERVGQFIDKQCSVFRGNIGAEFDAMLDSLNEEFAAVVLGFPNNGRTTLHSVHYVYGTLLENSQFKNDPVHPMTCSNLCSILGEQTKRRVSSIHFETYDKGMEFTKLALERERQLGGYCIMDVRNNKDLEFLAELLKEERIVCGSSALSEHLAKIKEKTSESAKQEMRDEENNRIFCVAGSLTPQTVQQTQYLRDHGYPVYEMDTRKLLDEQLYKKECIRMYKKIEDAYQQNCVVMVHSMNTPELVQETKELAKETGINNTAVSALVSGALSEIAVYAAERLGIRKFIICGGDTSASFCAGLGIEGMQVQEEIETGLPTCRSVDEPYYQLVLKSGSFGSPEFLEKAVERLNGR